MSNLYGLTDEQMECLRPFFPKSHGRPQVDDRRVLGGILSGHRNGLRGRGVLAEDGPPKTLYNRWRHWGSMGVFARMMAGLAAEAHVPKTIMIDAAFLKAHRTASSLRSGKGGVGASSGARRVGSTPSSTPSPMPKDGRSGSS